MGAQHHPIVAVFGASTIRPGSAAWQEAETCGRLVAEIPMAVATGGYGGAMEAVSAGAAAAGGRVIGITAPGVFPRRTGANPYVTEVVAADSITERIHLLVSMSSAAIVLPGSLGTFAELVAAWNTAYVAPMSQTDPKPVVTIGDAWRSIVDHLADALAADRTSVVAADDVEDAVDTVRRLIVAG